MSARQSIYDRLSEDIFGPADSQSEEILTSYPSDVYLTGILFPQNASMAGEDVDQLQAEGRRDVESQDVSRDEISLATVKRPASAGVSFVVTSEDKKAPVININFSAGTYEWKELPASPDGKESVGGAGSNSRWVRKPVTYLASSVALDFSNRDFGPTETQIPGLSLHIRTSPWKNGCLATVAMVNAQMPEPDYERTSYEELCFFQTSLRVSVEKGTRLCPRPVRGSAVDDDSAMAELIYRNVVDYAVGHTCSAEWPENEKGEVIFVETSWLPSSTVRTVKAEGAKEFSSLRDDSKGPVLGTGWLSSASGVSLVEGLRKLPELYEEWLKEQHSRKADLPPEYREQAQKHFDAAQIICRRIGDAIDLIERDECVENAFRLANRAIQVQRKWSETDEETALVWYPFQLAFILLSLQGIAEERHPDRQTVDLLWFPTGGGKTEAYLGLIAFTLFLRRLRSGDQGAGVAAIMRYTLRVLTLQQFQRAATLICVCDAMRQGEEMPHGIESDLGRIPFSLGLWVGGDATPNQFQDAEKALRNENETSRPDQLENCPKHKRKLIWGADQVTRQIHATCPDPSCKWHEEAALPIFTVDTDVYRECPSLVIGTIDKFAQIARYSKSGALFGLGRGEKYRQPDLIIQDELHLISGPLGTLAALYEIAIDRLCMRDQIQPKVIASTATIRQAAAQIKDLFGRETCLFPQPVLDATNSGFAIEDLDSPGRQYVGVTTAGRSAKFTLQAVTASLLGSAGMKAVPEEVRDDFWTLVTYFNSLRELGGALVLMQDDVPNSLRDYARRRKEIPRKIGAPLELTSRGTSSADIKEILASLETGWRETGSCDVLLASNMISVGVDVQRLGLMIVNGQPKSIAEYIQATSRVGRRHGGPGGLVVTLYNNAKARDRSHYETFRTWHQSLYREVEATSVTPFAPRARQRAIHATLIILARHLVVALKTQPMAAGQYSREIHGYAECIRERVENIDPDQAAETMEMVQDFVDMWVNDANEFRSYWNDYQPGASLMISAEKAAEIRARKGIYRGRARPTLNSMRNVEPGSAFILREQLGGVQE